MMQPIARSWQRLVYLDETQHDVLCRILDGGIHIDAMTPAEMIAVNSLRVQCGLGEIEGIGELLP